MLDDPSPTERIARARIALPFGIAAALSLVGLAVLLVLAIDRIGDAETRRAVANERRCDSLLEVEVREQRLVSFAPATVRPGRASRMLSRSLLRVVLVPVAVPLSVAAGWQRFFNNYRTAGRTYRALLRLERRYGDVVGQASEWSSIGRTYQSLYGPDSASLAYARSYGLYRLAAADRQAVTVLGSAGQAACDAGDTSRALGLLRVALLHYVESDERPWQAWTRAAMGGARMGAGNHEAALRDYTAALDLYGGVGSEQLGTSEVLVNISMILNAKGEDWFREVALGDGMTASEAEALLVRVRKARESSN